MRELAERGADVRVVMTRSAQRFVTSLTFSSLSGNPVATELWESSPEVTHVELARRAELVVVAPATAHALAKMAVGWADDLFSTTLLNVTCPVLVAPAMHTEMWEHPATQDHVATLEERGVVLVGPAEGPLLSGDVGAGRMSEPEDIVTAATGLLERAHSLEGTRFVVTAGGTQEPIDPVRFIGNRSSGLMGFAIAREAVERGAKVTLIAGDTSVPAPRGIDLVRVGTAEAMRQAVLSAAPHADVVVKAAAVADFRPAESSASKLKKAEGPPRVELVPTPDILAELGADPSLRAPGALLVGFAAETESDPERLGRLAEEKRRAKKADVIVANDVASSDSGFGARTNRAVLATPDGLIDVGLVSKRALARALMDHLASSLRTSRS